MDSFIQNRNVKTTKDADLFGRKVSKGASVRVISSVGDYNGFKMRVPPPEFEALFLDHALSASILASELKSKIRCSKSTEDGMYEIEIDSENYLKFFEFSQNFMASIAFSISALESWANNTIQSYVTDDYKPVLMEIEVEENRNKKILKEFSNLIPSNRKFSIQRKVFRVIPIILNCGELSEHNKVRKEISTLIEDRNTIMHMQDNINERTKINFAVSMFKRDNFYPVDLVVRYFNLLYKNAGSKPKWLIDIVEKRKRFK